MPGLRELTARSRLKKTVRAVTAGCALLLAGSGLAQASTLTLEQALKTAFAGNPDLAAAQWEIGIAEGDRKQAGLIPNPEVSWEAEDTRRDSRTTTMMLSQPIELGGKRGARIDVASRAQDAAGIELENKRNALRADVIQAFNSAQTAQQRFSCPANRCYSPRTVCAWSRGRSMPENHRRSKALGRKCSSRRCAWS